MEITKDERRQHPVNRVHYHIVVKDHNRTHDELRKLFESVWRNEMPESAFKVTVIPFDDNEEGGWQGYIGYFVKLRDNDGKNVLFKKGLRLRRYYDIGQWWTYPDGTPRKLSDIDAQIQRYADTRRRLKETEMFISLNPHYAEWEQPTDPVKLKAVLDRETDETLYDWFSIMLDQPTVFQTVPPRWLIEDMLRQPLKGYDLLDAIYERIRCSSNSDIIIALEIYHGL